MTSDVFAMTQLNSFTIYPFENENRRRNCKGKLLQSLMKFLNIRLESLRSFTLANIFRFHDSKTDCNLPLKMEVSIFNLFLYNCYIPNFILRENDLDFVRFKKKKSFFACLPAYQPLFYNHLFTPPTRSSYLHHPRCAWYRLL